MKRFKRFLAAAMTVCMAFGAFSFQTLAANDDEITLYLVRHGRTLFNTIGKVQGWVDSPLTDAGIEGAEDTGMGLADVKFDAVFSSDRGRAVETAEIIMGLNGASPALPIKELADLRETYYGKFEGRPNLELWGGVAESLGMANVYDIYSLPTRDLMNAAAATDETGAFEDYDTNMVRLMRGLEEVVTSVKSGNVLVVAHGGAISNIVASLGAKVNGELPNGSVTIVRYKNGKYTFDKVGSEEENAAGKAIREGNGGKPVYPAGKGEAYVMPAPGKGKVTLYIARHGRTLMNTAGLAQGYADSPLTDAGVTGAINTGLGLKGVKFDAVYTSDLGRTIETARLMLGVNEKTSASVPQTKLKDLREYFYGKYEGDPNNDLIFGAMKMLGINGFEEFAKSGLSQMELIEPMAKDPESLIETNAQFFEQINRGLDRVVAETSQKEGESNVLVVAHGMVMMGLLERFGVKSGAEIPNAAVVKVVYENGKFTLENGGPDLSYNEAGAKLNPQKTIDAGLLDNATATEFTANGKKLTVYTQDGKQYFPVRDLAVAAGVDVSWDKATNTSVLIANGKRVALRLNTNWYYNDTDFRFINGGYSTVVTKGEYKWRAFAPIDVILDGLGIAYTVSGNTVQFK